MKAKNAHLRLSSDFIWEAFALLVVGIMLAFANKASAAVSVTGITAGDIPAFSDPSVVGRMYGRVGYPSASQHEVWLYGSNTASSHYLWGAGGDIMDSVENESFVTLTLSGTGMSLGINGDGGIMPALGPVGYNSPNSITTLFVWITSSASTNNSASMSGISIVTNGEGSQSIGDLSVFGGSSNGGKTFDGFRIDLTGSDVGQTTLGWNQIFERDPGIGASDVDFQINVVAVHSVPEPSMAILGILGTTLLTLRRRR